MSHSQKFLVTMMMLAMAACSKQSPPHDASASNAPLIEPSAADAKQTPVDEFRSHFAPGGIEASYRATFANDQIQTLEETRKANARTGEYEFRGARLMKYRGAALSSDATIELEFDERGKVLVAKAGTETVSAEEIGAIRDRAQSLRSHAVSKHSVKGHDRP